MYRVLVTVPVGVKVVCPCAIACATCHGLREGATSMSGPAGTVGEARRWRVVGCFRLASAIEPGLPGKTSVALMTIASRPPRTTWPATVHLPLSRTDFRNCASSLAVGVRDTLSHAGSAGLVYSVQVLLS